MGIFSKLSEFRDAYFQYRSHKSNPTYKYIKEECWAIVLDEMRYTSKVFMAINHFDHERLW